MVDHYLSFSFKSMTLYYTRTPYSLYEKKIILNCFIEYEEAVKQASQLLLITCFPSIEIVDMDTDKVFISITRVKNEVTDTNIKKLRASFDEVNKFLCQKI